MCADKKNELTEKEKKEQIKGQINECTEKEIDEILQACKDLKDIKDFAAEVAVIRSKYEHLEEKIEEEKKERKEAIREFKVNYVDRFNKLESETKKNRSKIGDAVKWLQKEIEKVDEKICNSITELSIKIEQKVNDANKGTISFMWVVLSVIAVGFISFWVREFIQYMGWIKP